MKVLDTMNIIDYNKSFWEKVHIGFKNRFKIDQSVSVTNIYEFWRLTNYCNIAWGILILSRRTKTVNLICHVESWWCLRIFLHFILSVFNMVVKHLRKKENSLLKSTSFSHGFQFKFGKQIISICLTKE